MKVFCGNMNKKSSKKFHKTIAIVDRKIIKSFDHKTVRAGFAQIAHFKLNEFYYGQSFLT